MLVGGSRRWAQLCPQTEKREIDRTGRDIARQRSLSLKQQRLSRDEAEEDGEKKMRRTEEFLVYALALSLMAFSASRGVWPILFALCKGWDSRLRKQLAFRLGVRARYIPS